MPDPTPAQTATAEQLATEIYDELGIDPIYVRTTVVNMIATALAQREQETREQIAQELETHPNPEIQSVGRAVRKGWYVGREAEGFA